MAPGVILRLNVVGWLFCGQWGIGSVFAMGYHFVSVTFDLGIRSRGHIYILEVKIKGHLAMC